MKLTIEGLKPMYETLANAIEGNVGDREVAYGALDGMARMILSLTTTYDGLPIMDIMMNVEKDLKFISGGMTQKEEDEHIKFHYDLIEERDKELKEFIRNEKK